MNADELKSSYNKMIKSGLLVEVVNSDGINTMVTAKGYEVWQTLNIFISNNGTKPVEEKPKKTGQDKMDGVIKTVKMDMANAGIGFGQEKPKAKTYKKKKTRSKKQ